MPRGTRIIEDPKTGIRIQISRPAQFMIGTGNVDKFARLLTNIAEALGAEQAYVGRSGFAVEISLIRSDGWKGVGQFKKGGGRE